MRLIEPERVVDTDFCRPQEITNALARYDAGGHEGEHAANAHIIGQFVMHEHVPCSDRDRASLASAMVLYLPGALLITSSRKSHARNHAARERVAISL